MAVDQYYLIFMNPMEGTYIMQLHIQDEVVCAWERQAAPKGWDGSFLWAMSSSERDRCWAIEVAVGDDNNNNNNNNNTLFSIMAKKEIVQR